MKKCNKLKLFIGIFAILLVMCTTCIYADVGGINRYDSDSSSGSSSYGISVSGGGSFWFLIVLAIVFVVILYIYGKSKGKINNIKDITNINKMKNVYSEFMSSTDGLNLVDNTKSVSEEIRATDEAFSEENFLSWVKDVFLKIQAAWSKREWKIIRPFESNELFEQHSAQLQEFIDNNKINIVERVAVNSANLVSHRFDGDKEILEVHLAAVMRDYVVDATTNNVIEGDKDKDWHMKYKLVFARKNGVKTELGTSNKSTTNCVNCGAPVQITSAGQCEYCGSIVTTGEHDWVLTSIEGLK